MVDRNDTNTAI